MSMGNLRISIVVLSTLASIGEVRSQCAVIGCAVCTNSTVFTCQVCNNGYYIRSYTGQITYDQCLTFSRLVYSTIGMFLLFGCCFAACYFAYKYGRHRAISQYVSIAKEMKNNLDQDARETERMDLNLSSNNNRELEDVHFTPVRNPNETQIIYQNPGKTAYLEKSPRRLIQVDHNFISSLARPSHIDPNREYPSSPQMMIQEVPRAPKVLLMTNTPTRRFTYGVEPKDG